MAALYPHDHPYHWMTIGAAEDIRAAHIDDVRAFSRPTTVRGMPRSHSPARCRFAGAALARRVPQPGQRGALAAAGTRAAEALRAARRALDRWLCSRAGGARRQALGRAAGADGAQRTPRPGAPPGRSRRAARVHGVRGDGAVLRCRARAGDRAWRCAPALRRAPYHWPGSGQQLRVLVLGGSQGARSLNDLVAPALSRVKVPLAIVHQVGRGNLARAAAALCRAEASGRERDRVHRRHAGGHRLRPIW